MTYNKIDFRWFQQNFITKMIEEDKKLFEKEFHKNIFETCDLSLPPLNFLLHRHSKRAIDELPLSDF